MRVFFGVRSSTRDYRGSSWSYRGRAAGMVIVLVLMAGKDNSAGGGSTSQPACTRRLPGGGLPLP